MYEYRLPEMLRTAAHLISCAVRDLRAVEMSVPKDTATSEMVQNARTQADGIAKLLRDEANFLCRWPEED